MNLLQGGELSSSAVSQASWGLNDTFDDVLEDVLADIFKNILEDVLEALLKDCLEGMLFDILVVSWG